MKQLVTQAVVQQTGEFLGRVAIGQIRATYIADEQRVAGENGPGLRRALQIRYDNADTFERVPGRCEESEAALTERDFVAIFDCMMRERCARARSQINLRAGALCQLVMAGHEVGVQVRFNDVRHGEVPLFGGGEIEIHIALRIDYCRDAV